MTTPSSSTAALCENVVSLILLRHPLILLDHLLQAFCHGLPLLSYPLAGLSLHLPALSCLLRHPLLRRLLLRPFRAICGCILVGLYVVVNLPCVSVSNLYEFRSRSVTRCGCDHLGISFRSVLNV